MVNEKSSIIQKKNLLGRLRTELSEVSLTVSSSGVRSLPCIYHIIYLLLFNGGTVIILLCSTYYFIMTYYCTSICT